MQIATARKLHERRFRANTMVTTGELVNLIGSEGIQEALQNRWIVPDMDTGFLSLNTNGGKMQELENACVCPSCQGLSCECKPVFESISESMPSHMRESFAGPGLTSPSKTSSASPMSGPSPSFPRPQPASPTTPVENSTPQIGDSVVIADQGKDYTGRVASVGQDGRYKLSFGATKPGMDRDYNPNELRKVSDADINANA